VQLRDAIRGLIVKGSKSVLLNMGDVSYIDSSGLGELVSAYTTAKNQQAEVKLLNLTKKVHDLLQLTKLYHCLRHQGQRSQRHRFFQISEAGALLPWSLIRPARKANPECHPPVRQPTRPPGRQLQLPDAANENESRG